MWEEMEKISYKCYLDQLIYGTSFQMVIHRRWFNPLRYLLGREKRVYLAPKDVYIKKGGRSGKNGSKT